MKPDEALRAINEILSPPPRMEQGLKVYDNAYGDLHGALIDLERLHADPVCIRTIERVLHKLKEVSKVLQEAGYKEAGACS